jgi:hypothetical protein
LLLCNDAVNTSLQVNQYATIEEVVFSVGATLSLYNKDLRQLELELSQVPELAGAAEDSGVHSWQNNGKLLCKRRLHSVLQLQ